MRTRWFHSAAKASEPSRPSTASAHTELHRLKEFQESRSHRPTISASSAGGGGTFVTAHAQSTLAHILGFARSIFWWKQASTAPRNSASRYLNWPRLHARSFRCSTRSRESVYRPRFALRYRRREMIAPRSSEAKE